MKTNDRIEAFAELERGVYAALETYSNVHRGSGHNSMVSTHLYEQSRDIVLEYLGLDKGKFTVIFCTPSRAASLVAQLEPTSFHGVSSHDLGLAIGIEAVAVRKNALPGGIPGQTGGGTARLLSESWVVWAGVPDRFEAGTPAVINAIALAKALRLTQQYGKEIFQGGTNENLAAAEILYHDELDKYTGRELLDKLRQTMPGRGMCVPTCEGNTPFINLDNSASTPAFFPVWNTFRQVWRQSGAVQQEIVQEVKSICASAFNAPPADYEVIFTSNTTEAINLVSGSLSHDSGEDTEPVLLNTLLEHSSNDLPWRMIPHHSLVRLPVNAEGLVDLNELETLMCSYNEKGQHGRKRIRLMAVSGASNVLGVCNNIKEISRIVHRYGARLLVDAAQLVAHRKVDMADCHIDYLVFSAHKVYAPFGSGALMVRKGLLNFNTAEMQQIRSSGEENAGGIAALGKALVLLQRIGMELIREEEQALTVRILRGLAQIPGVKTYGLQDPESPLFAGKIGVMAFGMKSMMSDQVAKELALRGGIGIRYGCHCAHIITKRILNITPFIEQFQRVIVSLFPKLQLPGVARVSLGIENDEEDVDRFIHVLDKIARHEKNTTSANNGTPILPKSIVQQQMADFVKTAALRVFSL
jgi:selenocysteine lyase/cysteine desulfurase